MNDLRLALASALLAFSAVPAGVAWLITHQGYPDVVYYERLTISSSTVAGEEQVADLWVDPARNVSLRIVQEGSTRTSYYIEPGGHAVVADQSGSFEADSLSGDDLRSFQQDNAALVRGGFLGLADARLSRASGPIHRVTLLGRPALEFETAQHGSSLVHLLVWLDARTHMPLQLQVTYPNYTYTQTVEQTRRIAPNSLPPDFFAAPRRHNTLWDNALSWVHEHLLPGR